MFRSYLQEEHAITRINLLKTKVMKTTLKLGSIALAALMLSFTPKHARISNFSSEVSINPKTAIKWKSTEISLGEITQNKPVTIEFEFKNTGEVPVIITSVQASCGCTSTNYSKTPIAPGESTKITAVFNAATKGVFKKQVTVVTNAEENPQALTFTGTVI